MARQRYDIPSLLSRFLSPGHMHDNTATFQTDLESEVKRDREKERERGGGGEREREGKRKGEERSTT